MVNKFIGPFCQLSASSLVTAFFVFVSPCYARMVCSGAPPHPASPPDPNPNCARAAEDLLTAGPPIISPTYGQMVHWVSNPAQVNDSVTLGHLSFRHAEAPDFPCEAKMYSEPLLNREDSFSWKQIGDVLEDIYVQCTVWGAAIGVGTVGPMEYFYVEVFREGGREEERQKLLEQLKRGEGEEAQHVPNTAPHLRILGGSKSLIA